MYPLDLPSVSMHISKGHGTGMQSGGTPSLLPSDIPDLALWLQSAPYGSPGTAQQFQDTSPPYTTPAINQGDQINAWFEQETQAFLLPNGNDYWTVDYEGIAGERLSQGQNNGNCYFNLNSNISFTGQFTAYVVIYNSTAGNPGTAIFTDSGSYNDAVYWYNAVINFAAAGTTVSINGTGTNLPVGMNRFRFRRDAAGYCYMQIGTQPEWKSATPLAGTITFGEVLWPRYYNYIDFGMVILSATDIPTNDSELDERINAMLQNTYPDCGKTPTLILFGDSRTANLGLNPITPTDTYYKINAAVSGATSSYMYENEVQVNGPQVYSAYSNPSNLATIWIGVNDAYNDWTTAPAVAAEVFGNIQSSVTYLIAIGWSFIVCTEISSQGATAGQGDSYAAAINTLILASGWSNICRLDQTPLGPSGAWQSQNSSALGNATVSIVAVGGVIHSATLVSGGTGYTPSATFPLNMTGGSGTLGLLNATTNSSGVITSVSINDQGSGFGTTGTGYTTTVGGATETLYATGGLHPSTNSNIWWIAPAINAAINAARGGF